jgi:hypothetical protein
LNFKIISQQNHSFCPVMPEKNYLGREPNANGDPLILPKSQFSFNRDAEENLGAIKFAQPLD